MSRIPGSCQEDTVAMVNSVPEVAADLHLAKRSHGIDVVHLLDIDLICPKYHSTACSNLILSNIIILISPLILPLSSSLSKRKIKTIYNTVRWCTLV